MNDEFGFGCERLVRWDEVRRAQVRAELDAYYARLHGLTRDELRYILDPKEVHGRISLAKSSASRKRRKSACTANISTTFSRWTSIPQIWI